QIASFSTRIISYHNVIDNLNVLDYDYYFKLTEAILNGNISASLMIFDKILDKGFDGHNFINGLSRHFRDLLVCRDEVTLELLEVGAGIRENYKEQAKKCTPDFLINGLSLTNQCDLSFRSSKNQRLHVELCLVQLCGLLTTEKKKSEHSGSVTSPRSVADRSKPAENTSKKESDDLKREASASPVNNETVVIKPESVADTAGNKAVASEIKPEIPVNNQGDYNYTNGTGNTISIKDAMKGTLTSQVEETQEEESLTDDDDALIVHEDTEDFTEKDLTDQWKKFANQIKDKRPRLYNTLLTNKPVINSQTNISFEISNNLQQEALNKIKPELLNHLRRTLNSNLQLELSVNETLQESRLYLPEDKYEHMLKKNPKLAVFRQKFNLDFE
ncbi:MAG: hypothetical protein ACLFQA_08795, partial [Bacteroidales bacterium]